MVLTRYPSSKFQGRQYQTSASRHSAIFHSHYYFIFRLAANYCFKYFFDYNSASTYLFHRNNTLQKSPKKNGGKATGLAFSVGGRRISFPGFALQCHFVLFRRERQSTHGVLLVHKARLYLCRTGDWHRDDNPVGGVVGFLFCKTQIGNELTHCCSQNEFIYLSWAGFNRGCLRITASTIQPRFFVLRKVGLVSEGLRCKLKRKRVISVSPKVPAMQQSLWSAKITASFMLGGHAAVLAIPLDFPAF